MTRLAALTTLLALAACAQVEGRIDSPGQVYVCDEQIELCYFEGSAEELSAATGLSCRGVELTDRPATWFGCWYHCGPERGCNSRGGCWCPEAIQ